MTTRVVRPINPATPGYRISQYWGNGATGPNGYHGHPGTDYAVPNGTPIYAPCDSLITWARYADGFGYHCVAGWCAELGISWTAGHGQAHYVYEGQYVRAGDHVADVDTQGFATGPHLHFEVRPLNSPFGGNPPNIDSEQWLQLHLSGALPTLPSLTAQDRAAIRHMQQIINVPQDGVWGKQTDDRMQTLRWKLLTPPNKAQTSTVVRALQGSIYHFGARDMDGVWGPKTDAAYLLSRLCWLNK